MMAGESMPVLAGRGIFLVHSSRVVERSQSQLATSEARVIGLEGALKTWRDCTDAKRNVVRLTRLLEHARQFAKIRRAETA